jgi:uncharacterized protein YeeX (DUF496 family)
MTYESSLYDNWKYVDNIKMIPLRDALTVCEELETKLEKTNQRFLLYQKYIKQIDNFLEYVYKEKSAEEIKDVILGFADNLNNRLRML